jgi:hypothetical protein
LLEKESEPLWFPAIFRSRKIPASVPCLLACSPFGATVPRRVRFSLFRVIPARGVPDESSPTRSVSARSRLEKAGYFGSLAEQLRLHSE